MNPLEQTIAFKTIYRFHLLSLKHGSARKSNKEARYELFKHSYTKRIMVYLINSPLSNQRETCKESRKSGVANSDDRRHAIASSRDKRDLPAAALTQTLCQQQIDSRVVYNNALKDLQIYSTYLDLMITSGCVLRMDSCVILPRVCTCVFFFSFNNISTSLN